MIVRTMALVLALVSPAVVGQEMTSIPIPPLEVRATEAPIHLVRRTKEITFDNTAEDSYDNPFFSEDDLDDSFLAELPFELHGRFDISVLYFRDDRNVDGRDRHIFNTLNPGLLASWEYSPGYRLTAEIEYEGEDGKLELDQLMLEITPESWPLELRIGQTYVPFGIERHFYSSTTNPLINRPAPFRRVFPGTFSDMGIFLLTERKLDENGRSVKLELAVTRGLHGPTRGDRPKSFFREEVEGQLSGRLAFSPFPGLEIGGSGLVSWVDEKGNRHRRIDFSAVDLLWQNDLNHLRFEYVSGRVERSTLAGGDFRRDGWYVEVYRRFPFDRPNLVALEGVLRFDSIDENNKVDDFRDVCRWSIGANWVINKHLRLKSQFELADEHKHEISNNGFFVQLELHF